jgi:hypothetical protein
MSWLQIFDEWLLVGRWDELTHIRRVQTIRLIDCNSYRASMRRDLIHVVERNSDWRVVQV